MCASYQKLSGPFADLLLDGTAIISGNFAREQLTALIADEYFGQLCSDGVVV